MKRYLLLLTLTALLVVPLGSGVGAAPLTAEQLTSAGWTCFPVPGLGVHCVSPATAFPPTAPNVAVLYFDEGTGAFAGTETLTRDDVFQRRRTRACPTEENGFFALTLPTGTYWACHRS